MVETFKHKSRIITFLAALFAFLATYSLEQVQTWLPEELKIFAPFIVMFIAFTAKQLAEEKRIRTAEAMVHESYQCPEEISENAEECVVDDDVI